MKLKKSKFENIRQNVTRSIYVAVLLLLMRVDVFVTGLQEAGFHHCYGKREFKFDQAT